MYVMNVSYCNDCAILTGGRECLTHRPDMIGRYPISPFPKISDHGHTLSTEINNGDPIH